MTATTTTREPTEADLAAVAALLADIERIDAMPVKRGGGKQADGSSQMPFVVYAPEAERLIRALTITRDRQLRLDVVAGRSPALS